MDKSVEGSCGKNDSRTMKKRSTVASSKLGAARGTNREKPIGLGDQTDKPWHTNLTHVSKLQPVPAMKRKFQKTAEVSPKTPPVYNLRSSVKKTDVSKDRPSYSLRSKVQKTEGQNASTSAQKRKTPKKDSSKDSSVGIQNKRILKTSSPPASKIEATKSLTTSMASLGMKNQPLTSQEQPYLHEPVYHIKWEGCDMENGPSGQNCIICNKDLSGVEEDDDDSEYNDDYQYEVDEDDDDYEYFDDLTPTLLPAVDILPCGHAYHTECMQQGTSEEHLNDPKCVLCSKMV